MPIRFDDDAHARWALLLFFKAAIFSARDRQRHRRDGYEYTSRVAQLKRAAGRRNASRRADDWQPIRYDMQQIIFRVMACARLLL